MNKSETKWYNKPAPTWFKWALCAALLPISFGLFVLKAKLIVWFAAHF